MDFWNMEYPPDGNFHCTLCECHTIGFQSYESHMNGSRHAKNLRKLGKGKVVSQVRYLKVDDREPELLKLLKNVNGPIIGLDRITEKHRDYSIIIYNCNVCGGTFSTNSIVEHILSSKHKILIIGKEDPGWSAQIRGMKLSKEAHDSIVEERAYEYQRKNGEGKPELIVEKSCLSWKDCDKYSAQHTENAYNAAHPGASCLLPPAVSSSVASSDDDDGETQGGITDIDLERDSDMINTDMKIEIMKCMIKEIKVYPNDEATAHKYVELLKDFTRLKLLHKVRQLPPVKFNKLAKLVKAENTLTFDEFVLKNSFWRLNPDGKPTI